jgi:hypothetical protein
MWIGIAALQGVCSLTIVGTGENKRDLMSFLSVVFIIVSLTSGLVASAGWKGFKDKS